MKRKFLILSLITVLINFGTVSVKAGNKEDPAINLPFAKKMKLANGLYKVGSFYSAEQYYAQLKKEQPRNPYITYMIAECFRMTRDYPSAADFYLEAYSLAPEMYPEAPFKEGQMRKQNGDYVRAIERFEFFRNNYKGKNKKNENFHYS